ncbi:hypothetical protein F6455_07030 [Proteobacteria bacterium 005FR1]|nr:hypothetical protein [Proteobacteria bacterium 005FR1]
MMHSANNTSALIIAAPSLAQQRVVVISFVLLTGALVWWQNADPSSDFVVQKFSQTPLPDVVAQLDFTSAEASWNGLEVDQYGNLKIGPMTQSALVDAIAVIQDESSELQTDRLALVLGKQFGETASQQIMELVPALKNYGEVEQRWWEKNGGRNPPPYEELFQLQNELLGKTLASTLFSEQRRLAKMMLASQNIHNDVSLTQAQKDAALMDLQKAFQEDAAND